MLQLLDRMLPAPRDGGFRMEGYWVWCGSVVRGEDNKYHMFASRWPKTLPMHPGWLVASEVVRAVADTPEGPYTFAEVVLPARGPEYWDGRSTHNPQIVKWQGNYILYYMGTTHPFLDVAPGEKYGFDDPRCVVARANKRIGMAVAKSVFGPWQRLDAPILSTRPGKFDSFLVSNPAPCIRKDGSVLLVYKARAYLREPQNGYYHGDMTLGVATAERFDGTYHVMSEQPLFAANVHVEDPFVWETKQGYAMIAKDMRGNICGEKHGGILATSEDGLHWTVHEGVKAYSKLILWDDGTYQVMGNLERPFMLFQDGVPTHMFFAAADGPGGFANAANTWNMVIPLQPEDSTISTKRGGRHDA